ncbi:thiS family protein [Anopheles sinensis]|uniref:ThiS family protein n=1 Tax=Anopheles sinensis TaxID=74873 RepID=A0A084WAT4_ANOSI|nr:thiS family protein [Anopheles sinensis]
MDGSEDVKTRKTLPEAQGLMAAWGIPGGHGGGGKLPTGVLTSSPETPLRYAVDYEPALERDDESFHRGSGLLFAPFETWTSNKWDIIRHPPESVATVESLINSITTCHSSNL